MNDTYMKLVGSGAAEAIPNPFCKCKICENARAVEGNELRTRSCFRVNESIQIDFGPDQNYQTIKCNNDLNNLTSLLITHTHDDHFCFNELNLVEMSAERNEIPIKIYLSEIAYEWAIKTFESYKGHCFNDKRYFEFIPVKIGEMFKVDNLWVKAFIGNHGGSAENEFALNYLITLKNNKKVFYAVDTGYFLEETFKELEKEVVDFLIIECTFGSIERGDKPGGHLDCKSVINVVDRLYKQGTIHSKTKIITTHINHKHEFTHEYLQNYFDNSNSPVNIEVGYDGMIIKK